MPTDFEALRAQITPTVREHPGARYVMLFGSTARGTSNNRSDIDLAVGGSFPLEETFALESSLERSVGRPVQVVVVEEAPPALRARIFREGILLWERDRLARVRDHERTIREYLDFRPVEAMILEGVARRFRKKAEVG